MPPLTGRHEAAITGLPWRHLRLDSVGAGDRPVPPPGFHLRSALTYNDPLDQPAVPPIQRLLVVFSVDSVRHTRRSGTDLP
jgi:hypothetical protein